VQQELETGREIQLSFLPHSLPVVAGWEIAHHFHPAHEVSGDFYDVFDLLPDRLALIIGDVCDKGVGSAIYMALFRSLLHI
jgi:serine phosphatase RsbU (regulator of sigma subunit)